MEFCDETLKKYTQDLFHDRNNDEWKDEHLWTDNNLLIAELDLFLKILEPIKYLHSEGYAHTDLKLNNIMRNKNGSIKIADFGFASKQE